MTQNDLEKKQIALGCDNGFIYLVKNYQLKPFINVGNYISNIQAMDVPSNYRTNGPHHMLLCAGHFNALNVYIEDKVHFCLFCLNAAACFTN